MVKTFLNRFINLKTIISNNLSKMEEISLNTYTYTGGIFDIEVQEQLSDEGILDGQYGALHFKRCADGYAIYNTSFIGSGFVCTPTSANLSYPNYINGVPVTEIHNSITIKFEHYEHSIAIEGKNIKRAYLYMSRKTLADEPRKADGLENLIMAFFDVMNNEKSKSEPLPISICFYNGGNPIDLCEIRCDEKCVLIDVKAKKLEVVSPSVILSGKANEFLEYFKFSGRAYPNKYSDWDGEIQCTDYFENIEGLKHIDGSLCGDLCWSFKGCKSLEQIHLSNGIQRVPSRAFANCSSLTDLYIPDTVTEIGEYAFEGCTKLTSIHLPSSITKIPEGLFKNCSSLQKCYLSDNIEEIGNESFKGCSSLRRPWIPKNIKKIGENAFDDPSWSKIF